MLQQTQVATVIPYFNRFLTRFPTIEALAEAPLDDVLRYWAGLGYYARARNLHRAAREIVERFGGEVPRDPAAIQSLPGIGRYTAGAILSIAYGIRRPLVDANVVRVLTRFIGMRGDPKSAANQTALWELAEELLPEQDPGGFNQALMELGALVCLSAEPQCDACPLIPHCVAGNSADPSLLPEFPPARSTVALSHSAAIMQDGAKVLLIRRPPHGLWGGLWEFPRVACAPGEPPRDAAARAAQEAGADEVSVGRRIAGIRHTVTHHRITLHGFLVTAARVTTSRAEAQWVAFDDLEAYACAAPQSLLRDALQKHIRRDKQEELDLR
jgi:A/G-specific adenine glycosylase